MATTRQVLANRANSQLSTGPRTLHGKRQSRRNALRHGLTAETVAAELEDKDSFTAFYEAILREHPTRSVLKLELLGRLTSLLWRLRRAGAIETGLLAMQFDVQAATMAPSLPVELTILTEQASAQNRDLARAFLRTSNFNGLTLDRLGRYEAALSRQVLNLLVLLRGLG
jgi:hypothetical protein